MPMLLLQQVTRLTLAIEKLNMQPPLHLGVALKPSEEERLKTREQDLLNRAWRLAL